MSTAPPLSDVVTIVQERLDDFFPAPTAAHPHRVSLVGVREQTVGIGNRRGNQSLGDFSLLELKGLRLAAHARFELWGADADGVNTLVENLQQALLAAREALFNEGYLKLEAADSSSAELVDAALWRRTADYLLLFEYRFSDTDGAQSLIARIPIHSDPERANSPFRETTVVTDEMVRWDNETAPALVVRGPRTLARIGVLDFQAAAAPTGQVTMTRTFDGAVGSPTVSTSIDNFVDIISDPVDPQRHATVTTASLNAFLTSFTGAGTMDLGDWDGDSSLDTYQARVLSFGRSFSDLAIDAVDGNRVTSAAHPFRPVDRGSSLAISDGVGFDVGDYHIVDVDAANVATLNRSCGAAGSTNGVGHIDRPLVLPGAGDRFEVTYGDSAFDQVGVLYLRAAPI